MSKRQKTFERLRWLSFGVFVICQLGWLFGIKVSGLIDLSEKPPRLVMWAAVACYFVFWILERRAAGKLNERTLGANTP